MQTKLLLAIATAWCSVGLPHISLACSHMVKRLLSEFHDGMWVWGKDCARTSTLGAYGDCVVSCCV